MWNSPDICAYDWSNWKGFLIGSIWRKTKRIRARFEETPEEVAARLPKSTKLLLVHVNLSIVWPFIADSGIFSDVLVRRGVRVLNCDPPDIRKRTLQAQCQAFGLPTVAAEMHGPGEELLIVKTDLNSGGRREQLLSAAQRARFNLPADVGRMKHPDDYYVGRRADLAAEIWTDPTLVAERFVKNPSNRFFRVYVALNSVLISEAYTDVNVKRMEGPIRRHNHMLWRDGDRIYGESHDAAKLPQRLLEIAGLFLARFRLEYGAVDVVESESGEFYVVDLNRTPYWGDEKQPGMLEHLRLGFSKALGR